MPKRESLNSVDEIVGAPRCTAVAVYTNDYIFHGYIHHAIGERLLDVLNQGSIVDQPDLPHGFLLLTEVEAFSVGGKQAHSVADCLLNKAGTFLIGERNLEQAEPPPTIHYRSSFYKQKKPFWVNILMPMLTVVGQLHITEWQSSMSVVDAEKLFLPVTKAKILSGTCKEEVEFEFGAVNRGLIIAIMEAGV